MWAENLSRQVREEFAVAARMLRVTGRVSDERAPVDMRPPSPVNTSAKLRRIVTCRAARVAAEEE